MNMKVIIVGGGKVGTYLASLLLSNGHQVKLLEDNEKLFNKAAKELPKDILINENATEPEVLEKVGIASADVLAAVTEEDQKNLVVSTLAKMEFGVAKVIARVNNPKNTWLYNSEMGVDVQVNQADIIAHLVVEEMDMQNMFTLMKLNRGEYSIVQMNVKESAKAANKLLKDLSIPKKSVLISVTRDGEVVIPKGDTQILAGDEILILTDETSQKELQSLF